jgi:hypothetical protein
MRKFFLISSAAVSLFAVGCATPQSVCETGAQNACAKIFECSPETVKGSTQFKEAYGTNAAECETKQIAANKCSEKKEFDQLCADGKKYDLGKASECSDAIKAQSCADFNDASKRPAACGQICT